MSDAVEATAVASREVKVWDIWLRAFHWLLVTLVVAQFTTGHLGGNWLEWHTRCGFTVLGLLVFRIVWGIVGSHHARFANFLRGPGAVIAYLKGLRSGEAPRTLGHNPMGALSVMVMLLSLLIQAMTGLFANDDITTEGPYAGSVSKAASDFLTVVHKANAKVLIALAVLHLLAIGYYVFIKKENLVKAMLTGNKPYDGEAPAVARPLWLAPVIAVVVGVAVYWLVKK
ncbi:MAG: cytochrome b/b6 domain-containing protein [Betaproteobacteria bacterium]|nr:cytochrome b/b6 domain-containing protein [Betaproteobacteria bacterium]